MRICTSRYSTVQRRGHDPKGPLLHRQRNGGVASPRNCIPLSLYMSGRKEEMGGKRREAEVEKTKGGMKEEEEGGEEEKERK